VAVGSRVGMGVGSEVGARAGVAVGISVGCGVAGFSGVSVGVGVHVGVGVGVKVAIWAVPETPKVFTHSARPGGTRSDTNNVAARMAASGSARRSSVGCFLFI